jgi:L-alanine-DL-glutamate epimerase-like enolase superfamily enzyme
MGTVRKIEARHVRVPLDRPAAFSNRLLTGRDYVLVRAETSDGATGLGFTYVGHTAGSIAATSIRELLGPLVVGEDQWAVEAIWDRMHRTGLLHGRAGAVVRAMSAVDIALWDANARTAGVSLARLLGGPSAPTVPCYASGGYYAEGKDAGSLADEFSGYVAAGFAAVKMKVGRLDPQAEEERVRRVREAVGPGIPLMLDANNAWNSVAEALRYLRVWEPYDPFWIEEPFQPDDVWSHARLARETPVPIATGEIGALRWYFRDLMEREAVHFIQPDAPVIGGITEYRRVDAMASVLGVPVCPHWFDTIHVHMVAASPGAIYVEYFPDDEVFNFRRLVDRRVELMGGELVVPSDPGLGTGFDERAVDRFAVDAWA